MEQFFGRTAAALQRNRRAQETPQRVSIYDAVRLAPSQDQPLRAELMAVGARSVP